MASALLQTWSGHLTAEEVNFLARPIEDVAEEYIRTNLRHKRARKTKRDRGMAIDYFVSLVGNLPVGEITEKTVEDFRDQLLSVPSEYGKGVFYKRSTKNGEVVPVEEFVNEERAERFHKQITPIEAIDSCVPGEPPTKGPGL